MSGVTFFTLGYGDVVPHSGGGPRSSRCSKPGTGIGFIAIVISYLPVLYQLFARREAHVHPARCPRRLAADRHRHAVPPRRGGGLDKLDDLLREWEVWGADLLESHLSYPMLAYYRSQHDNQSWLAALAAIMDCCALILVGVRGPAAAAGAHDLQHGPADRRRDGALVPHRAVALRRRRPAAAADLCAHAGGVRARPGWTGTAAPRRRGDAAGAARHL